MTQRDMMRTQVKTHAPDWGRVCSDYAQAEQRGEVDRQSNSYGLTGEEYAWRLLRDGQRKGWL